MERDWVDYVHKLHSEQALTGLKYSIRQVLSNLRDIGMETEVTARFEGDWCENDLQDLADLYRGVFAPDTPVNYFWFDFDEVWGWLMCNKRSTLG